MNTAVFGGIAMIVLYEGLMLFYNFSSGCGPVALIRLVPLGLTLFVILAVRKTVGWRTQPMYPETAAAQQGGWTYMPQAEPVIPEEMPAPESVEEAASEMTEEPVPEVQEVGTIPEENPEAEAENVPAAEYDPAPESEESPASEAPDSEPEE